MGSLLPFAGASVFIRFRLVWETIPPEPPVCMLVQCVLKTTDIEHLHVTCEAIVYHAGERVPLLVAARATVPRHSCPPDYLPSPQKRLDSRIIFPHRGCTHGPEANDLVTTACLIISASRWKIEDERRVSKANGTGSETCRTVNVRQAKSPQKVIPWRESSNSLSPFPVPIISPPNHRPTHVLSGGRNYTSPVNIIPRDRRELLAKCRFREAEEQSVGEYAKPSLDYRKS